jgi:hypothetical protein
VTKKSMVIKKGGNWKCWPLKALATEKFVTIEKSEDQNFD